MSLEKPVRGTVLVNGKAVPITFYPAVRSAEPDANPYYPTNPPRPLGGYRRAE